MKNSPEHLVLCSESSDYNQGEAEGKKVAKEAKKSSGVKRREEGLYCVHLFFFI